MQTATDSYALPRHYLSATHQPAVPIAELARATASHPEPVYAAIRRGALPAVKIGGHYHVKHSDWRQCRLKAFSRPSGRVLRAPTARHGAGAMDVRLAA